MCIQKLQIVSKNILLSQLSISTVFYYDTRFTDATSLINFTDKSTTFIYLLDLNFQQLYNWNVSQFLKCSIYLKPTITILIITFMALLFGNIFAKVYRHISEVTIVYTFYKILIFYIYLQYLNKHFHLINTFFISLKSKSICFLWHANMRIYLKKFYRYIISFCGSGDYCNWGLL